MADAELTQHFVPSDQRGAPVRRVGVLTGGGDCPGLNAVLRGFVKTAVGAYGWEVLGFEAGTALSAVLDEVIPWVRHQVELGTI